MSQTFDSVACSLAELPIGVASRGTPFWQDHPATVVLNVGAGGRAHWGHRIDLCLVYRQPLPHWAVKSVLLSVTGSVCALAGNWLIPFAEEAELSTLDLAMANRDPATRCHGRDPCSLQRLSGSARETANRTFRSSISGRRRHDRCRSAGDPQRNDDDHGSSGSEVEPPTPVCGSTYGRKLPYSKSPRSAAAANWANWGQRDWRCGE